MQYNCRALELRLQNNVSYLGCQLLIRPDELIRSDGLIRPDPNPIRPENKWIGYGFNFFDPNRVGSTRPNSINYIF
jgi:hypothetical protein